MTGKEYQELAMRTNDGKACYRVVSKVLTCDGERTLACDDERLEWLINRTVDEKEGMIDVGGLLNGCLGLAGESGETLDMIKKWIFHEKELDKEHLKKEIGDVMWYVAMICESAGFDLDDVLQTNIDKLKARYPEGFDTYLANHRKEGDI